MSIEAYDYGKQDGIQEERERILDWIDKNHTSLGSSDGVSVYINLEALRKFIKEEK